MPQDRLEQDHPDIYTGGPTGDMVDKWLVEWGHRRMKWAGIWPGVLECREYGFWCLWGPDMTPPQLGWVVVPPGTQGAKESLNTLAERTVWDPDRQKYVLRNNLSKIVVEA